MSGPSVRSAAWASCLLLTVLAATSASGHGPAPSALDAIGPVPDGPAVVRTNIGLATRAGPNDYYYVCPIQWGSEEVVPPMVRFGPALFTVHEGRAYFGDLLGCGFSGRRLQGWSGSLAAVVSDGAQAWAVARSTGRSQVWHFTGDLVERVDFPVAFDHAAIDEAGELRLVAARPTTTEQGIEGDPVAMNLEPAPQFLEWRGGVQFVTGAIDGGVALWARDAEGWVERARGVTAIHGPIRYAGEWLALVDGQVRSGPELATVGPATGWTCLREVAGVPLACSGRGMARIEGPASAPEAVGVFAIDDIRGPQPGCPLDRGLAEACHGQWVHFGGEAGLVDFDAGPMAADAGVDAAVDGTIGTAAASDGCAATERPSGPWVGFGVLGILACTRRRRCGD